MEINNPFLAYLKLILYVCISIKKIDKMEIVIRPEEGKVLAIDEMKEVGLMEFEISDDVMTIMHTRAFKEGKGIGHALVVKAIDYAKQNSLLIRPVCTYAFAVMSKNPEYSKLMVEGSDECLTCGI